MESKRMIVRLLDSKSRAAYSSIRSNASLTRFTNSSLLLGRMPLFLDICDVVMRSSVKLYNFELKFLQHRVPYRGAYLQGGPLRILPRTGFSWKDSLPPEMLDSMLTVVLSIGIMKLCATYGCGEATIGYF